jgi:hypothetical protein
MIFSSVLAASSVTPLRDAVDQAAGSPFTVASVT